MDIASIISMLEEERDRLDRAITALHGSRRGTKPGRRTGGVRSMSAAARKRISQAQKKRWAALKSKSR